MGKGIYLEMTYRQGKAMAGYLYLPRQRGDHAARSQKVDRGLVVDFAQDGRPIGIEIVSPSTATPAAINSRLRQLHQDPLPEEDLAPLAAK